MTTVNQLVEGTEVEVKELTAVEKRKATLAAKKAAKQAEVEAEKQAEPVKVLQIPVNGLSVGKVNVLNFTYAKKRIVTPFFVDLIADEHYAYDHHVNADRLDKLGEKFGNDGYEVFAYGSEATPDKYKGITPQSHGDLVKYALCKLIVDGKFSIVNNGTEYKMVWVGEPIAEPTVKLKAEPKAKQSKTPKADELAGLDFTSMF